MRKSFKAAEEFAGSLAGRIALILAVAISVSAIVALAIGDRARQTDHERVRSERVLASAQDIISRLQRDPDATIQSLIQRRIVGASLVEAAFDPAAVDAALSKRLTESTRSDWSPQLGPAPPAVCQRADPIWQLPRTAGFGVPEIPECWVMRIDGPQRGRLIALDLPPLSEPRQRLTDPLFVGLIIAGAILLSLVVARLATASLSGLAQVQGTFGASTSVTPVPERGPRDVRAALATFNRMQERITDGLRERTRMLAAISHDLQTPLTRLRLRLEDVADEPLRDRLIADLSATLAMIRRGLELARSSESVEAWTVVDIDSLLATIADEAAEFGQQVVFKGGCGARISVRPDMLTRCLSNLIENAVKYGGDAEIACRSRGDMLEITVRDHGKGLDDAMLARVFEPFVRGNRAALNGDGTGLGLAISRAQATSLGGSVSLANHPDGGLIAVLVLPDKR